MCQKQQHKCSIKIGLFKYFAKLTVKKLCLSLLFNKVAALRPATLLTKTQVFSCEFCKIFKNTLFVEHLVSLSNVYVGKYVMVINCVLIGFCSIKLRKMSLFSTRMQRRLRNYNSRMTIPNNNTRYPATLKVSLD